MNSPLMVPVCFINRAPRRLIFLVPAAKRKKRMNQNLIWLWCIIFILAGATDSLKTQQPISPHFKRFKLAKTLETAQECVQKFLCWEHIYCTFTVYHSIQMGRYQSLRTSTINAICSVKLSKHKNIAHYLEDSGQFNQFRRKTNYCKSEQTQCLILQYYDRPI